MADATALERTAQALRYAEHLAVLLAAEAFGASEQVRRVEFDAHVLWEEGSFSLGDVLAMAGQGDPEDDGEGGATRLAQLLPGADLYVAFRRDAFLSGCPHAAKGDPSAAFQGVGCPRGARRVRATGLTARRRMRCRWIRRRPSASTTIRSARFRSCPRRNAGATCPNASTPSFPRRPARRWARDGCTICASTRGDPPAPGRADRGASGRAESATEAIGAVRRRQQRADDPFAIQACTRLMAALAEGEADRTTRTR